MKRIITAVAIIFLALPALAQDAPLPFGKVVTQINKIVAADEGVDPIERIDMVIALEESFLVRQDTLQAKKDAALEALLALEETPEEGRQDDRDAFIDDLMGGNK